ncbi:VIR protein [Plasmodium vivax]|uniref:VIR protein n=1 Tax=Plasmodium vivax TaxID=5855 RepID=A0A1G4EBC5_PLAVI|nr:VIR protein [Plasmodium vivax]
MLNYCNGSHHQYHSYECYKYLSRKLNVPELSEDKKKYLENALKTLGKVQYNEFFKHDIINDLAARIGNDGVFMNSYANTTCNYINYKLNESLRTHYSYKNSIDYSIFKKFAKEFHKEKFNNYNDERSCEKYIEHLDDDIYNRMTILYKMYYYYDELKNPYKDIYITSDNKLCDNLSLLIRYSNHLINNKKINHESIKSIRNLKEIIEKDNINERYKKKCDLRLLNGMLTEHPNSNVRISREEGSALVSQVTPKTQQHNELEHKTNDASNEQAPIQQAFKEVAERELAPKREAARELTSKGEIARDLSPEEETAMELASQEQESGIQVKGIHAVMYPLISQQVSYDQEVTGRSERRYISNELEAPTSDKEGLLDKMQGFITETLGQVEPAPILGVSGGMGALFLLFKYTPVGTFFRGGRRINNQIPRTFYGQFPGGFPGYEEFYDGSFGPGPINISYRAERE